ncbi:hypothetical protein [Cardinium endosymbiont of Tipula unca]|uniref:hypothetical protein n=1 Tax=Cardinium endosymbiont of Tipula unca TaxID=3066216 RepID=UPI003BAF1B84
MLFCSIKGANRGYIQVLLATSRNRIYFRRRSSLLSFASSPHEPFLPGKWGSKHCHTLSLISCLRWASGLIIY